MKKGFAVLTSALLALQMLPAAAEAPGREKDFTGIWADPAFDRMELMILPSEITWPDERMGEEAGGQKYVVWMNWASSAFENSVYHIVGTADADRKNLVYEGGILAEYAYLENGEADPENTSVTDDQGTGVFTLTENDTLLWQDSCIAQAGEMELHRVIDAVPAADEILQSYYLPVAGLESGTAGASLKLAETVCGLFRFCQEHYFWNMDADAFAANLEAAQQALTAEQRAAFDVNRGTVTLEAVRLLAENEESGSTYADAGAADAMNEMRNDPSVRLSAETFLFAVETLNVHP